MNSLIIGKIQGSFSNVSTDPEGNCRFSLKIRELDIPLFNTPNINREISANSQ